MVERLLKRVAKSLARRKIPYMVIGGQAVLLYGSPRLTRDIDITLGVDTEAYGNMVAVSKEIGLKILPKQPKRFVLETKVLPTEDPFSKFRVDFIFSNTPYERQAIQRAKRVTLQGSVIHFASLEDLMIHKMFAGRAIDLEDVKTLMIQNRGKVNVRYIRRWLREFSRLTAKEDVVAGFDRLRRFIK